MFDLLILRTHEYVQIQGMNLKYIGIDSLAAVCHPSCLTACTYVRMKCATAVWSDTFHTLKELHTG